VMFLPATQTNGSRGYCTASTGNQRSLLSSPGLSVERATKGETACRSLSIALPVMWRGTSSCDVITNVRVFLICPKKETRQELASRLAIVVEMGESRTTLTVVFGVLYPSVSGYGERDRVHFCLKTAIRDNHC
jgi:hypothetical protein